MEQDIVQQYHLLSYYMLSKQEILANRNKLRGMTKISLVKGIIENRPEGEKPEVEPTLAKIQRRDSIKKQRKKSEDLSIFENPCRNRDVYINNHFFELFRVQEKLGEGAQSIVKKCTELSTNKVFAVKLFRSSDCELIRTLKTQYKILKILDHPKIVKASYLFVNEQLNSSQLVLQYCPYSQLKDHLDRNGQLEQQEVSDIIGQILMAVSYMHEKRICHRDIKPQNVLYDTFQREVKMIDFEISKMNRKVGKIEMWTMTGTVYYKAPQMFAGKYDQAIDLWSIGVMTYQLLTGKLPFMKEYINDTIEDIKNYEPHFPSHISKFALDFIRRCLVKNPAKRITAKQALSCPFIIQCENGSVLSSPTQDKMNQSFDSKSKLWTMDEGEEFKLELKCVDDMTKHNDFLDSHDIGIRCCDGNFLDDL